MTKRPADKTSLGKKRPKGQNFPGTKRPKGQNIPRDKTSQEAKRPNWTNEAHYLTCVANYLIQ